MVESASIVRLLHHNFHIFPYPYHTTLFPFVQLLFFKQALNPDVENFLRFKAIEFARQGFSQTHLVMASYQKEPVLVGYFTLANKYITVSNKNLSTSQKKRLAKFSIYDNQIRSYYLSAPLIAQLGKNYSKNYNKLITGDELLCLACRKVSTIQMDLGGKFVYLECEDKPFLIEFYSKRIFVKGDFTIKMKSPDNFKT